MFASAGTFRSLRTRNARLFFGGLMVSNVGTWLQSTAMSILVYRLTGQATSLGVAVALQFLPMLFLGAWAGALADRRDKRTMCLVTQGALTAQALVLAVLDFAGAVNVGAIYVLSFVLGVAGALDNPARRGLVAELVPSADISNAMSLNTAVMTGSRVFGPALAAALIGPLGTAWCFMINALSFVAVLGSLVLIDATKLHRGPLAARGGTPVRDALRFVMADSQLRRFHVVLVVVSTFAFNHSVSLPKLSDVRWGDDRWFGWVLSMVSVGSVIGSLLVASRREATARMFVGSVALLGVSGPLVAWAPSGPWAFVGAIPLGIGGAGFLASFNGLVQQKCPPDMRGRLLALSAVAFLGSTPIGGPITGVVADQWGAEWSLAYGSFITLAAALYAFDRGSGAESSPPGSKMRPRSAVSSPIT
ncbi:MAG: MFS transporter [Actinomycetota bacterium]|nr:MFS transporter [Actinomycetota bacterium]MDA2970642.1 MFS transporter [Actinomycetota bacterium]MDA3000330.1 MFS transporter [Actinomycetota bacterium]